jgi:hypothetical protein
MGGGDDIRLPAISNDKPSAIANGDDSGHRFIEIKHESSPQ